MPKDSKVDATIMMYSDSKQERASFYHRGKTDDLIAMLIVAGLEDERFGKVIIKTAMVFIRDYKNRGISIDFTEEELNQE